MTSYGKVNGRRRTTIGLPPIGFYKCSVQEVHVVGAGGIGVALGWALAQADWKVTMVETNPRKLTAGSLNGLQVDGVRERRVHFANFEDWTAPDHSIVLLCTKTYNNAAALARIGSRRRLVPVQNGFDPLLDTSEHPFEGIASFVSQCEPDIPSTRITRPGELYLGGRRRLHREEQSVLESLATGLVRGGRKPVQVVDLISPYKSSKLMYNAAISPLAASAGMDNGELLTDPVARRLFFALLKENYTILRRHNLRLARIGPFPPWLVNRILRVPGLARTLAHFFRPGLKGTYCSMAPDIGTGQTEIAAYNGHLTKLAGSEPSPINTAVSDLINRMQKMRLPPSRARLRELWEVLETGGMV